MSEHIKSKFEPRIKLDEIKFYDTDYGTGTLPEAGIKALEQRGVEFPHITINECSFNQSEVQKMIIDCTNHIPRISLKLLLTTSSKFLTESFPKDGDLISVFIRGKDDLFKPIRNDYLITSVISNASALTESDGRGLSISMEGELNIPGLYNQVLFAKKGNSYQIMEHIAKELELGFATNIDATDDEMTWICSYETYLEFMKHVSGAAWKDKLSFFTFFIDVYYHLNFINVNSLINYNAEMLIALAETSIISSAETPIKTPMGLAEKCFSNGPMYKASNFYIRNYKPINNSSNISKNYGYALNILFYDFENKSNWQLQATNITTSGAEKDKLLLRGRPGEDFYNEQQNYNYVGMLHNVHENFYLARAHNLMNNLEMDKLNVQIDTNRVNLNVYRYENMPCVFFITSDYDRINKAYENADMQVQELETPAMAIDKFYTGHYLVKGMTISYTQANANKVSDSTLVETFILSRREWPSPTNK